MSNKITFKTIIIVSLSLILFYLTYNWFYTNRIPPNTYFAYINISNKKSVEANNLISSKIDNFQNQPVIFNLDNKTLSTNLSSLGIAIDKIETIKKFNVNYDQKKFNKKQNNKTGSLFKSNYIWPTYFIDIDKFTNTINNLLTTYEQQAQNATIIYKNSQFQLQNEQPGQLVDRLNLIQDIKYNINSLNSIPIELSKYTDIPLIKTENAKRAFEKVKILNNQKITLKFEQDRWSLSGLNLINLLNFYLQGKEDGNLAVIQTNKYPIIVKNINLSGSNMPQLEISLNEQKLDSFLQTIASSINTPTQDANIQFEGGKVVNFTPARNGQNLNIQETKLALLEKISIDSPTIADEVIINLPVAVTQAKIASDEIKSLGIEQLLGKGVSYFRGSIANRIYNIGLGSNKINGTLVKPGEIFSFNNTVGEVSASSGYKQAYVISKGRTVLDDGGGICQVSTTVFRAALDAGLPIIARTAHAYRVVYYEQGGIKPGLDATVWSPAVDLAFKNDTPNHILIQAVVNKVNLKLEVDIYGTSDNRKVILTDPIISNQKPPPADKYEDDPTLPRGVVKQVDFSASGATSVFTRKVYRNDVLLYDDVFKSVFRPWQAVYLVGTGG